MFICSATDRESPFITALTVLFGSGSEPPPRFKRIDVDLNYKAGGAYVYIAYSKNTIEGGPITDIQVFVGDDENFGIQDGYHKVAGDLNRLAGGKYINLCYTRRTKGSLQPVRDIMIKQAPNIYAYPPLDWVRVDQDCQEGTPGGWFSYVCLKR